MTSKVADRERAAAIEGIKAAWAAAEATVPADELSLSDLREIATLQRSMDGQRVQRQAFLHGGPQSFLIEMDMDSGVRHLQDQLRCQAVVQVRTALLNELVDLEALSEAFELIDALPVASDEDRSQVWRYRRDLISALIKRKKFERAIQLTSDLFGESTLDYTAIIADVYQADQAPARLAEVRRLIAERIRLNKVMVGKDPNHQSKAWALLWAVSRDPRDLEMARTTANSLPNIERTIAMCFLAEITCDVGDFCEAFSLLQGIYEQTSIKDVNTAVLNRVAQLMDVIKRKLVHSLAQRMIPYQGHGPQSTVITPDQARWLHEQLVPINPRWAELIQQFIDRGEFLADVLGKGAVARTKR